MRRSPQVTILQENFPTRFLYSYLSRCRSRSLSTWYVFHHCACGLICVLRLSMQAYSTSFEQIERLRELMISFLNSERREFLPQFDVLVVGTFFGAQMSRRPTKRSSLFIDIPEQTKMTLKADIKYKSNWQQGALKCAFFCRPSVPALYSREY